MLRHSINKFPRKLGKTYKLNDDGTGLGHEGHLKRMRQVVGDLFRYERIESTYPRCDEARGYAERLIQIAARHGDKHKPTMEMADYWLEDKDLIHKLFKVLVPRYSEQKYYRSSYTDIWKLPVKYPGHGTKLAVLELKGNPWPPVVPKVRDTSQLLTNVLLGSARQEYHQEKKILEAKEKEDSKQKQKELTELGDSENSDKTDEVNPDISNIQDAEQDSTGNKIS